MPDRRLVPLVKARIAVMDEAIQRKTREERTPLFLYGELRAGFWNNFVLSGNPYLGVGKTRQSYALCVSIFPYVAAAPPVCPIEGDVYLVDAETLAKIDTLKGHPYWYERRQVEVELAGETRLVWMYFGIECRGKVLDTGNYLEYRGEQNWCASPAALPGDQP